MRLRRFRVALVFALALAPVVIAAVITGPSLALLAAFWSGQLVSFVVVVLALRTADALRRQARETPIDSEEICHRCGGANRSWSAPSPLWNAVMRGGSINGPWEFGEIICPTCFMVLAEERGIASGWWLHAQVVHVELETVTPSGRVWDEALNLWVCGKCRQVSDPGGHECPEPAAALSTSTVSALPPLPESASAKKYREISASPQYEDMNRDRRECVAYLRSDLYRLDPDKETRPAYDCVDTWRYVNPPGSIFVTLRYGERHLTGHVESKDGSLISATSRADVQWLGEVLP